MAEPILTAGAAPAAPEPKPDPRKEMIRIIRTTLRKPDATDDEYDQALEALAELSKD